MKSRELAGRVRLGLGIPLGTSGVFAQDRQDMAANQRDDEAASLQLAEFIFDQIVAVFFRGRSRRGIESQRRSSFQRISRRIPRRRFTPAGERKVRRKDSPRDAPL